MNQNSNNYAYSRERERESSKVWLWIILGVVLVGGIGTGIYFFTKSSENKNPDNPNTHYLPNEQEFQQKVDQLKSSKGLDDQQAQIEVLTQYVPYINWWEINSLSELDEKINLVNSKTKFPPFTNIPDFAKFNQELVANIMHKCFLVMASMMPRKADNTPDWQGYTDFTSYLTTVLVPQWESLSYKPTFATSDNYYELITKMTGQVNGSIASLSQDFANLTTVSELNKMVNDLLERVLQGSIYADMHDRFAKQISIPVHKKYDFDPSDYTITNASLNLWLKPSILKMEGSY